MQISARAVVDRIVDCDCGAHAIRANAVAKREGTCCGRGTVGRGDRCDRSATQGQLTDVNTCVARQTAKAIIGCATSAEAAACALAVGSCV